MMNVELLLDMIVRHCYDRKLHIAVEVMDRKDGVKQLDITGIRNDGGHYVLETNVIAPPSTNTQRTQLGMDGGDVTKVLVAPEHREKDEPTPKAESNAAETNPTNPKVESDESV